MSLGVLPLIQPVACSVHHDRRSNGQSNEQKQKRNALQWTAGLGLFVRVVRPLPWANVTVSNSIRGQKLLRH